MRGNCSRITANVFLVNAGRLIIKLLADASAQLSDDLSEIAR